MSVFDLEAARQIAVADDCAIVTDFRAYSLSGLRIKRSALKTIVEAITADNNRFTIFMQDTRSIKELSNTADRAVPLTQLFTPILFQLSAPSYITRPIYKGKERGQMRSGRMRPIGALSRSLMARVVCRSPHLSQMVS